MVGKQIKKAAIFSGSHNPNDIQYIILSDVGKSTARRHLCNESQDVYLHNHI